jgi:lysophospholipase L1-like esterase
LARRTKIRGCLLRGCLFLVPFLFIGCVAEGLLRLAGRPTPESTDPEAEAGFLTCRHDSVLGWVFPPHTEGDFHSGRYRTAVVANGLGLRNPEPDPGANLRLVVLGDSYAFGWGVEEEQAFPRLLERLARQAYPEAGVEVINAGIPGYAVLQQKRMLERLLVSMPVHRVVATFSLANDPVDELRLARYLPDRLNEYSYRVRDPDSFLSGVIRTSRLLTHLDRLTHNVQLHLANASGRAVGLAKSSLVDLVTVCRQNRLPLLLVVVPRASEIQPSSAGKRLFGFTAGRARQMAGRVAEEQDLTLLDLKPVLQAVQAEQPAYLPGDVHWSAAGNRAVAEAVFAALPSWWWEEPARTAPPPQRASGEDSAPADR